MLSVIVPALDEAGYIDRCLEIIARQAGLHETIVVDGGSTDETVEIALRRAKVVSAPKGRALQMNRGARAAVGDVFLFLHADCLLAPSAFEHLFSSLADPAVIGGTYRLRYDSDHWLLKLSGFLTRFRPRIFHYGDQGIFVRREIFERLNGFAEIPLMEDVEFLGRLEQEGRTVLLPCEVVSSARRFMSRGVARQQSLNVFLVALYRLGVDPAWLERWYRCPDGKSEGGRS